MQPAAQPRFRKRIPCRVRIDGKRHAGMVLNLSHGGLFVQTSAGARPGAQLEVELDLGAAPVALGAQVVWRRVVASHLRTVSHGGIGVRIQRAPEPFYDFVMGLRNASSGPLAAARVEAPAAGAAARGEPAPASRYRVRVQQQGGPRSRWLELAAASEADARRQALAEVGAGWDVLEILRRG